MKENPKILVVDTRADNLAALEHTLSELDIDIIRAASEDDVAKSVAEQEIALIISYIGLPEYDNFESENSLYRNTNKRILPIIFISENATDYSHMKKKIKSGAVDFITYPIMPEIVIGKVRLFLELYEQRKELESKNNEMERVLYAASHDLRSPLVNVEGWSKRLGKECENILLQLDTDLVPDEIRQKLSPIVQENIPVAINFIHTSVAKMNALLKGLLQLSRSGRLPLEMVQLDMNRLMADVAATFEYQMNEAGISIQIADLPTCWGDENKINQVFSNLIGNAVKYHDTGKKSFIKVSGTVKDNKVVYCLEDNGIGIPLSKHKEIFEIFNQLNKDSAGEGLGLAITNRIIERHRGKIWVDSKEGKGSKFYISLLHNKK